MVSEQIKLIDSWFLLLLNSKKKDNLKLPQQLSIMKLSQVTSHARWLNSEKTL
jgi:hypothetical protein